MDDAHAGGEDRREQIRELCHDAKNHLFIICSGLDMLANERHDEAKFTEMLDMIRRDGAAPLRRAVEDLAKLASQTKR